MGKNGRSIFLKVLYFSGAIRRTKTEAGELYNRHYYRYRVWHPFIWILILISIAVNLVDFFSEFAKDMVAELKSEFNERVLKEDE